MTIMITINITITNHLISHLEIKGPQNTHVFGTDAGFMFEPESAFGSIPDKYYLEIMSVFHLVDIIFVSIP